MKILIADDHPSNLNLLKIKIERLGHEVTCATTGKEAVDLTLENDFNLIILDLRMPVMDGYEAARTIKSNEKSQSIPIIALSANTSKDEIKKAMESGCEKYLTKPIMKEKLRELLDAYSPSDS